MEFKMMYLMVPTSFSQEPYFTCTIMEYVSKQGLIISKVEMQLPCLEMRYFILLQQVKL